nr:MAG TPA: hypothetical protein [Caudoviricetes sp.]
MVKTGALLSVTSLFSLSEKTWLLSDFLSKQDHPCNLIIRFS